MKKLIILILALAFASCLLIPVMAEGEDLTTTTASTEEELTTTTASDEEIVGIIEEQLTALENIFISIFGGLLGSGSLGLVLNWLLRKKKKAADLAIDTLKAQNRITQEEAEKYKKIANDALTLATVGIATLQAKYDELKAANETLNGNVETLLADYKARDERLSALLVDKLAGSELNDGAD